MTVRIDPSFNLSPRDGSECMNELKVRLHNLNSPFMQNRERKMRFEGGGVEYIIPRGVKYLPRGTLEVCSASQGEILMDYSMIGPFG